MIMMTPFNTNPPAGQSPLESAERAYLAGATIEDVTSNIPAPLKELLKLSGGAIVRNALQSGLGASAVNTFIDAIEHTLEYRPGISAVGVGYAGSDTCVWLFTDAIDVENTRRLFELKSAIELNVGGAFELHVKPTQGRSVESLLPSGFRLLDLGP